MTQTPEVNLTPPFRSADALLRRYEDEPHHVRHVAVLATQLFDALGESGIHELGNHERDLLIIGALLHDIGWSQTPTGENHHKWSARLIMQHGLEGLPKEEIRLVAQIARYHRRSLPKDSHLEYHRLTKEAQELVYLIGGIVRVADALDRTHRQIVRSASIRIEKRVFVISAQTSQPWGPERAAIHKKGDLLELALCRKIQTELAR